MVAARLSVAYVRPHIPHVTTHMTHYMHTHTAYTHCTHTHTAYTHCTHTHTHLVGCEVELLKEGIVGVYHTDGVGYWVGEQWGCRVDHKQLGERPFIPFKEVIQGKLGVSKECHLYVCVCGVCCVCVCMCVGVCLCRGDYLLNKVECMYIDA